MSFALNRSIQETIQDVAAVGQILWQKGWAEKNAGNLSVDVTDYVSLRPAQLKKSARTAYSPLPGLSGRCYLVTGTGTRYRDIEKNPPACLCLLRVAEDLKGYHLLWGGQRPGFGPTSELSSHLRMQAALLKAGGKQKVVLHTHPNELIALTHLPETAGQDSLNRALWSMIPEAKLFVPQGVGWVPYRLTGSDALAGETVKVLSRGYKVVMWEKHGALAVGRDPQEAFDLVDAMNKAATLYLLCKNTGVRPQGLTLEQIEEIGRAYPPKD